MMTIVRQTVVVLEDEADEPTSSQKVMMAPKNGADAAVLLGRGGFGVQHRLSSQHMSSTEGLEEGEEEDVDTVSSSFRATTEEEARNLMEHRFDNSNLGCNVMKIPIFHKLEIELGQRLGKGGFSNVDEIRGIYLRGQILKKTTRPRPRPPIISRQDSVAVNDIESRQFIASHATRRNGHARYALKRLRIDITNNTNKLLFGLCDLVVETQILSSLEHPNIIKLRAISNADPYSMDYFLILDRLYDTLQTRLYKTWKIQDQKCKHIRNRVFYKDQNRKQKQELLEERLVCAFDLSDALRYLHANNIIHRDIKPENIGFDVRGDIKIFDFGMAKELLNKDFNEQDGLYRNMSKMTGTLRYMAPEVFLGNEYNASCDVYSFAIMFWEIMALQLPLSNIKGGPENFVQKVVIGGVRPPTIHKKTKKKKKNRGGFTWPKALLDIMEKSWSASWQDRYTMEEISDMLRTVLVGLRGGNDSGLEHQQRRSTDVFCPDAIETAHLDDSSLELNDVTSCSDLRAGLVKSASRSLGRALLDSISSRSIVFGNISSNRSNGSLQYSSNTIIEC